MFLFYSGYGVSYNIKKGDKYISSIPQKRLLKTLANFDIAVCVFFFVNMITGTIPSVQKFILSLLAWDEIGNSNWYIFAIMLLYAVTFFAYKLARAIVHPNWGGYILVMMVFALTFIMYFVKPAYWYNTMWAYAFGVVYTYYQERIDNVLNKGKWYIFTLLTVIVLFIVISKYAPYDKFSIRYNILSVIFAALVVIVTMRIKIDNKILRWCGERLFPIYIYQRIPMMFIENISGGRTFISTYPILYMVICLMVTIIIAYFYPYWSFPFGKKS